MKYQLPKPQKGPHSNLWWFAYAMSLRIRGTKEPDEIKEFVLKLRAAERKRFKKNT